MNVRKPSGSQPQRATPRPNQRTRSSRVAIVMLTALLCLVPAAAWTIVGTDWAAKSHSGKPSQALVTAVHGRGKAPVQANIESTDLAVDFIDTLRLVEKHGGERRRGEARDALQLIRDSLDRSDLRVELDELDPYCRFAIEVITVLHTVAQSGEPREQQEARMSLERIRRHLA
jgi:hypothetical protein